MTAIGSVSEMGYVSLRTRDLRASVDHATRMLGLTVTETTHDKVYLAAQNTHHELVYTQSDQDGVDHFGLVAANLDELAAIEDKVRRAGYPIVASGPIEDHIESGFAFVGPEGYTWHVYLGISRIELPRGYAADRYGHINVKAVDSKRMRDFLVDIFDFRVSDQIGEDFGFFLRCNTDHHGVAIMKSDHTSLHHHAWQAQSIEELGKLGDRLARSGTRLAWGPVRHGAGHNVAAYYIEPAGGVVELYTDLERIFDKERQAVVWDADDLYWVNQWDGYIPPRLLESGFAPVKRA